MAKKIDEETVLGNAANSLPDEQQLDSRDVTPEDAFTPAQFDLASWMEGLSPVRRAVTIYGRKDLCAHIDILSERLKNTPKDSPMWHELTRELAEVREQYEASAMDVVVRGLTPAEARPLFQAVMDAPEGSDERAERELEYTAAHIVKPDELDIASLRSIARVLPQEVDRITIAATLADQTALGAVSAQFR